MEATSMGPTNGCGTLSGASLVWALWGVCQCLRLTLTEVLCRAVMQKGAWCGYAT